MTSSRWLAVLVFLIPTLPPYIYGLYVVMTNEAPKNRLHDLPWYKEAAGQYAAWITTALLWVASAALIYWWVSLIIRLWSPR